MSVNHPAVKQLFTMMQESADPKKAVPMQAYMKTDQPFYGIQAGPRKEIFRKWAASFSPADREEYEQVISELWRGKYREDRYLALETVTRYKKYYGIESWTLYCKLMHTATNWDTLDWIAAKIMSPLVQRHRELEKEIKQWRSDENFWARRAALLVHLKHKSATNTELLAETILSLAPEKEFFIRKAIGWVLREYAKTNAEWVRNFVARHEKILSALSRKEALKNSGNQNQQSGIGKLK